MSDTISRRRTTAAPPLTLKPADQLRIINATLRFITPVFGGGVRVTAEKQTKHLKQPDPITPVRGASLRGQLREWWRRACCIGLPIEVMRDRESILWGWASTSDHPAKGWVSLSVDQDQLGPAIAVSLDKFDNGVKYGGFPLRPEQGAGPGVPDGKLHRYSGPFKVRLEARPLSTAGLRAARAAWPSGGADVEGVMWAEVERAFLAWSTLGGLGARTRRGFGAVERTDPKRVPFEEAIAALGWGPRIARSPSRDLPKDGALEDGLSRLMLFRQGREIGRNKGQDPKKPGRSRWPEPDAMRRLTRMGAPQHRPEHPVDAKYPRAAFGMPIIFHFKDHGEPRDGSLQPKGAERLASPVLIRPVRIGAGLTAIAFRIPGRDKLDALLPHLTVHGRDASGLLTSGEQGLIKPLLDHRAAPAAGADAVLDPFFQFFSK